MKRLLISVQAAVNLKMIRSGFFHLVDERLTCFVAEKHFVKIGSRTGFIKKIEAQFHRGSQMHRRLLGDQRGSRSFS